MGDRRYTRGRQGWLGVEAVEDSGLVARSPVG
jgi:hypothetical protein